MTAPTAPIPPSEAELANAAASLDRLVATHVVRWHWVKGHAGHLENERADELAGEARLRELEARSGVKS